MRKTVKCIITEQNQEVNKQPAGVFVRPCHHCQSSPSTEMREKLLFMQKKTKNNLFSASLLHLGEFKRLLF